MNTAFQRSVDPSADGFKDDVLSGLASKQKVLPQRWAFDSHGVRLLQKLYQQPEYYAARAEACILADHAQDISEVIGAQAVVIEYGCENLARTIALFEQLKKPKTMVPVTPNHFTQAAYQAEFDSRYPSVSVTPLQANYWQPLPMSMRHWYADNALVFFPGSGIGRFSHDKAIHLLRQARSQGKHLLVGLDLLKSPTMLEAAYNDQQNVQQALNLNLLKRANRELNANFDVNRFYHRASYNRVSQSVDSYLISLARQNVAVAGTQFQLSIAEPILTGSSHKYSLPEFEKMADAADWQLKRTWMDENRWFAVQLYG